MYISDVSPKKFLACFHTFLRPLGCLIVKRFAHVDCPCFTFINFKEGWDKIVVYIPNTVNTTYPLIIAIRGAKNGLVTDRLKYRLFRFPK